MISSNAQLRIERIPIGNILVCESIPRYASMVMLYVRQMQDCPHDDPGLLRVKPSVAHPGLYELVDGHHRYVAAIIVGRKDLLCIVIDERATT